MPLFAMPLFVAPTGFTPVIAGSILWNLETTDKSRYFVAIISAITTITAVSKYSAVLLVVFQR